MPGTTFSKNIPGNGGSVGTPGPAFVDDWTFSLSGAAVYTAVSLSGTVGASLNPITNGTLALFQCDGACGANPSGTLVEPAVSLTNFQNFNGNHTRVVSITQTAFVGNNTVFGDLLSAGNYFFQLTGNYNNRANATPDAITGSVTITAVPEPSTWLMMLAGFAGLVFVGYRRTNKISTPTSPFAI